MKKFIYLALLVVPAFPLNAQQVSWKGKTCAVVLTYDDALNVHVTNALPVLDSNGLKATFYISDYFEGLRAQLPKWKEAAAKGHELGNHTLYHPCLGNKPGRGFVTPENDMNNYTVRQLQKEIRGMNTLLMGLDGRARRTFAFPCSDMKIRDTAYLEGIQGEFVGARAVRSEMPSLKDVDLTDLPSYAVNGESGEQLIGLVRKAMETKSLLVLLFHGVGGEHSLNVSLEAHRALLRFLKKEEQQIWVAPMVEVAEYIKDYQKGRR